MLEISWDGATGKGTFDDKEDAWTSGVKDTLRRAVGTVLRGQVAGFILV